MTSRATPRADDAGDDFEQNFMAMTELAQGHNIKVILCASHADQRQRRAARRARGRATGAAATEAVRTASAHRHTRSSTRGWKE
jgi:hypothetical protein